MVNRKDVKVLLVDQGRSMLLVPGIVYIAFVQSYHSSIGGLGPQGLILRKVCGLDEEMLCRQRL